jgi:hypothetical protein
MAATIVQRSRSANPRGDCICAEGEARHGALTIAREFAAASTRPVYLPFTCACMNGNKIFQEGMQYSTVL